jgi:hypothetical protein
MTSPAQLAANRANARRSTGPRSADGKARSAGNALKHGLTAESATLPCEDRLAHERLRLDLIARHQPEGEAEARLVDDLAFHYSRLARLPQAEAGAWNAHWQEDVWPKRPAFGATVEGLAHATIGFGVAVRSGVMGELVRLSLYEQRIRRAIEKTREQLKAAQDERRAAEQALYGPRTEAEAVLSGLAEVAARRESDAPPPVAPEGTRPPARPAAPLAEPFAEPADEAWLLARDLIPRPAQAPESPARSMG